MSDAPARGESTAVATELAPRDEVRQAFKAAMVAVRRLRGRETHRHGALSNAQYGLLFGLCDERPMSARDLAERADLSAATVTQMLEALEAAGLVERSRSEADKRIVLTEMTERGRAVVEEYRCRMEPRWQAALSEFTEAELRTAAAVLTQLANYFDGFAGSETGSQ